MIKTDFKKNINKKLLKKLILTTYVVLFLLASCRKPIDMDLHNIKSKLVVNSLFSPDSLFKVNITKDISPLKCIQNYNNYIDAKATVLLYENNNFIDTLKFIKNGDYISTFKPSVNNDYKIVVEAQGYTTVEAHNDIPKKIPITSISKERKEGLESGYAWYNIYINFKDPTEEKNYYLLRGVPQYIDFCELSSEDPVISKWDEYNSKLFVFDDELFNGKSYQITLKGLVDEGRLDYDYMDSLKYLAFNLHSITKEFYFYAKSCNSQGEVGDELFDLFQQGLSEPVPIYTNIENGLGIFAGYSVSSDTVRFE
ncbi:MAG: hypothetical protein DRJ01_10435 [Bacteroidetes bacterium]|nr:MAG: hypothetical protein DRJ01_10435 [Bacteroidota bacterium]